MQKTSTVKKRHEKNICVYYDCKEMGQNDSSHSYRLVGLWGRFLPQFCKDASDYVTFKASPAPQQFTT